VDFTRTVIREFETAEKAVLHVESRSGTVSVESHAKQVIRVEAVLNIWSDHESEADETVALVERAMEQDDQQRVIIRAPSLPKNEGWAFWGKRGTRVDYIIRVPVRTAVRALSRSGRIGVVRTEGRVHAESGSGRITIEDVTGDVAVVTRSGNITITNVTGMVTAEARSGRVEARGITGKCSLQSRSGSLDAREIEGDLEVRAHTGTVTMEQAHGSIYGRAHTGGLRFAGRIEGDMSLSTHTGTIQLAVDPAQPFFLDAESEIGTVRSELPPRRGGAAAGPPKRGPKVRLRAHTGSIRITRL
jgi:DUF4097 and DUF4098 domain-containing protein YvlB